MKHLSEILPIISRTVETSAAKANTPPPGSMVEAGKAMTQLELSRDRNLADTRQVAKLASLLRMNSLWPTAPDDSLRRHRIEVLSEAVTPCTFEDASYWLARFLHHFPTKNAERDGVIISDLAADFETDGFSIVAIVGALDELRSQASIDNPWLPPSGAITDRVKKKSELLASCLKNDRTFIANAQGKPA